MQRVAIALWVVVAGCGPSSGDAGGDDDSTTPGNPDGGSASPPLTRDYVEPGLPASVVDDFDALDTVPGLTLVYPNADAIIPRDLAAIDVQAADGAGRAVFRVTFAVDTGDALRGFVTSPSWLPDDADWQWLMGRAAGHAIDLSMAGAGLDGDTVTGPAVTSPGQALHVSADDATGAMFYFATTGDQVTGEGTLERLELGAREPDKYLNRANSGGNCVGCHSLSRDGARLSYAMMDVLFQATTALVEAEDPTARQMVQGATGAIGAFDPTGERFVASTAGALAIYDAQSGAKLVDIPTSGPAMYPDWSWDGNTLVFVRPTALCQPGIVNFGQDNIFVYGGALVTMRWNGSQFVDEQVVVPASASANNYYPAFSPDGSWIAFARADAATPSSWALAATACNGQTGAGVSYDNPSATIWLVPATGGDPVALGRANETGLLTNSWPKWAPKADGEYLWLSLSSTREYGTRLTGLGAHHQIWISAIRRPNEPIAGDPSAPAVWLPFQTMATKNHLGQWSYKVGDFEVD